ncbi:MAG: metalloprotease TldD [Acidobacteria bacterium CG_4_9_14_3_um_filter_49_7]|nr:MAG: metalloprotease TldD [Acidobacteria bacterium CG_4_9_14_3_um_filter_49_7]
MNRLGVIPFSAEDAHRVFSGIRKGTFSDIFLQYRVTTSVRIEDGIVKSATRSVSAGTGIRIVDGESTGYSFCENFELDDVVSAAGFAQAIAASGKSGTQGMKEHRISAGMLYPQKIPLLEANVTVRSELVRRVLKAAESYDPLIDRVTINMTDTDDRILIFNSEGEWGEDIRPMVTVSASARASRDGNVQFGRSGVGMRMGFEVFEQVESPEMIGSQAAKQAIIMLDAKPAPAGMMPVVLAPGESGVLIHESVGHPLEADFIWKKTSAYTGRVGEQVASPLCTIVDDGTIASNRGALGFDDELTPTERSVLIEKGVLSGFMDDRITSDVLKMARTGNGRRQSFQYAPIPRMRTTFMDNGQTPPEEIIDNVKKGVYCVAFAGGQVNIASGDFVFVPSEAYLIENGKITTPIKNLTLIGNGPDALNRVDMVGNDFKLSTGTWICGKGQTVPVGIGLPTVRISELTVGGASNEE